jgi:hypothetical protein
MLGSTLDTYINDILQLQRQGGFKTELEFTNFLAAVHECIGDYEELVNSIGDDVVQQLINLDPVHADCRRETHVWTRYIMLAEVPKYMFGSKAKQRHCAECGLTQARTFTQGGRIVHTRSLYPESYQLKGVSRDNRVYKRHLWVVKAKAELDSEIRTIRRRTMQNRGTLRSIAS